MSRRDVYWNLRPRFGCGSPAAVWDEKLARRIAAEEKNMHEQALTGACGDSDKEKAEKLGLGGIVEEVYEKGGRWVCLDLITGRSFTRERKPASKVSAREVVTKYETVDGKQVEGSFKVEEVYRIKSEGRVMFRLAGQVRVFLWPSSDVTVEKDAPQP